MPHENAHSTPNGGYPHKVAVPHKRQREKDATFELTVRVGHPVFTLVMPPTGRWTFVRYQVDGSIWDTFPLDPDDVIQVLDRVKAERDVSST